MRSPRHAACIATLLAQHAVIGRQPDQGGRAIGPQRVRTLDLREPEVQDLRRARSSEKDILRLEIAMHHAGVVEPQWARKLGAALMIAEGALNDPKPEAIFGLHVVPGRAGTVFYRPRGFMAASDRIDIVLHGRQTHGAWPWKGIDVIAVAANVIQTVNTLTARTIDPTTTPTVFTIATVDAGVRYNIIPDSAVMSGTLRTFDIAQRDDLVRRARIAIRRAIASDRTSARPLTGAAATAGAGVGGK